MTLFVLVTAVIISMYGGGFATIPAYLRDLFGTMHLGAIHGRLITAWSMAAVLGPQLVNYISTYRIEHGVPRAEAYNLTMYLMAGLLAGRPGLQPARPPGRRTVPPPRGRSLASRSKGLISPTTRAGTRLWFAPKRKHSPLLIAVSWMIVLIPLGWGVVQSVVKSLPLFQIPSVRAAVPSTHEK